MCKPVLKKKLDRLPIGATLVHMCSILCFRFQLVQKAKSIKFFRLHHFSFVVRCFCCICVTFFSNSSFDFHFTAHHSHAKFGSRFIHCLFLFFVQIVVMHLIANPLKQTTNLKPNGYFECKLQ